MLGNSMHGSSAVAALLVVLACGGFDAAPAPTTGSILERGPTPPVQLSGLQAKQTEKELWEATPLLDNDWEAQGERTRLAPDGNGNVGGTGEAGGAGGAGVTGGTDARGDAGDADGAGGAGGAEDGAAGGDVGDGSGDGGVVTSTAPNEPQSLEIVSTIIPEDELAAITPERAINALQARFPGEFSTSINCDSMSDAMIVERLEGALPVCVDRMTLDQMKLRLRKQGNGDSPFNLEECPNQLSESIIAEIRRIAPSEHGSNELEMWDHEALCTEVQRLLAPPSPSTADGSPSSSTADGSPLAPETASKPRGKWKREKHPKIAAKAREINERLKGSSPSSNPFDGDDGSATRFTWEEVWDEYTSTNAVRNPYLKEYLVNDLVLKDYYQREWRYDNPSTFHRKDPTTWPTWMRLAAEGRQKEPSLNQIPVSRQSDTPTQGLGMTHKKKQRNTQRN